MELMKRCPIRSTKDKVQALQAIPRQYSPSCGLMLPDEKLKNGNCGQDHNVPRVIHYGDRKKRPE